LVRTGRQTSNGAHGVTRPTFKSLFENYERCCGAGFWLWARRRGWRIPAAGWATQANAAHDQKTRRPEGGGPKAGWLRCFSVEDPTRGILPRRASPASFWPTTAPFVVFNQALRPPN